MAKPKRAKLERNLNILERRNGRGADQHQIDTLYGSWLQAVIERGMDSSTGVLKPSGDGALLDIGVRSHPGALDAAFERMSRCDDLVDSSMFSDLHSIHAVSRWLTSVDRLIVSRAAHLEARRLVQAKYEVLAILRPVFETARDLRPDVPIYKSGGSSSGWRRIATRFALIALVVVVGLIVWRELGSTTAGLDAGASTDPTAGVASKLIVSHSNSTPIPTPNDAECGEVRAAHEADPETSTMQVSSPSMTATIPADLSREAGYALGFPTPPFEWSGIPPLTTELVLFVAESPDLSDSGLSSVDMLQPESLAGLNQRWTAVGIDPSSLGMTRTDVASGMPEGVREAGDQGIFVNVGDEWTRSKFVGPDGPGQTYVFVLYAMCNAPRGQPDDFSPAWISKWAIDEAHFAASSG